MMTSRKDFEQGIKTAQHHCSAAFLPLAIDALRIAADQMTEREKVVTEIAHWLPKAVADAMADAWNTICSDANAHPDDIVHPNPYDKSYLEFQPGAWARLTAGLLAGAMERDHSSAKPASGWRSISEAKKDKTVIWAALRPDIYPGLRPERPDLEIWNGRQLPLMHTGLPEDGFDIGWSIAAPVGAGGFPDEWIAGYMPLPSPPGEGR
jgi:hypothetical protein